MAMKRACARIVLAATGSGVGKTSITTGLAAALRARGLRVQCFKTGPDFLDPSYLAQASGRPCYNLDGWMCGRAYVEALFARATQDADVALIEGAMGLFDGAEAESMVGSTAEIARWLDAPVVLLADAQGAARSLAATLHGFVHYEPSVRVVGCIANRCGSVGHAELLRRAIASSGLPELLGGVCNGALPDLPGRHLGLVSASVLPLTAESLEMLRAAIEQCVSIDSMLRLAASAPELDSQEWPQEQRTGPARIAVARDEAFHFYYPDNLQALEAAGAQITYFSPLRDAGLPPDCEALYFGGGYPEAYAEELAANGSMLQAVRDFARSGRLVYAECGGLMYLTRGVETLDGRRHRLAGRLSAWTRMSPKLKALGYAEVEALRPSLFAPEGGCLRGHEFHYSELIGNDAAQESCPHAYRLHKRRLGQEARLEGFHAGNLLASYVHVHFASHPGAAARFVQLARKGAYGAA
jgi:cobyrinic acid a,c-diamide synthase